MICFNLKTEKIMKKQYISPEALQEQMVLDSMILGSITGIDKGDLTNDIGIGGSAEEGTGSDSRRHRNVWTDEGLDDVDEEF